MRVEIDPWSDVTVDGIPVGPGFGLAIEPWPVTVEMPDIYPQHSVKHHVPPRKFLTQEVNGEMRRIRELPSSAVLSAKGGDATFIV